MPDSPVASKPDTLFSDHATPYDSATPVNSPPNPVGTLGKHKIEQATSRLSSSEKYARIDNAHQKISHHLIQNQAASQSIRTGNNVCVFDRLDAHLKQHLNRLALEADPGKYISEYIQLSKEYCCLRQNYKKMGREQPSPTMGLVRDFLNANQDSVEASMMAVTGCLRFPGADPLRQFVQCSLLIRQFKGLVQLQKDMDWDQGSVMVRLAGRSLKSGRDTLNSHLETFLNEWETSKNSSGPVNALSRINRLGELLGHLEQMYEMMDWGPHSAQMERAKAVLQASQGQVGIHMKVLLDELANCDAHTRPVEYLRLYNAIGAELTRSAKWHKAMGWNLNNPVMVHAQERLRICQPQADIAMGYFISRLGSIESYDARYPDDFCAAGEQALQLMQLHDTLNRMGYAGWERHGEQLKRVIDCLPLCKGLTYTCVGELMKRLGAIDIYTEPQEHLDGCCKAMHTYGRLVQLHKVMGWEQNNKVMQDAKEFLLLLPGLYDLDSVRLQTALDTIRINSDDYFKQYTRSYQQLMRIVAPRTASSSSQFMSNSYPQMHEHGSS